MRKHLIKTILLALVMGLILPCPAVAEEESPWKKVPICTFGMPYVGHAVSPHETGSITSILKAIYKPTGIKLVHKELPYKRAISELSSGKIQCSLDRADNRKEFYQGKNTIAFYDLSVAHMSKTKWDGLDSLKDKKVAYLHGFDIEKHLPVKFKPQTVYDLSSAFNMLDQGQIPFILDDKHLLEYAMYDSKAPTQNIVINKIKSFEIRPIFSRTKEGLRFRNLYDQRMKEIIASGELAEILRDNGKSTSEIKRLLKANGH
jgi:polar amino acid transport system substrate-binding protein